MARTVIPFGPQHPVLPEPVHLDLVVEDEKVIEARPSIGFIHRGLEKLAETKDYIEFVYVAERICGICSFIHGQTYCQAIETIMNIEVPPRARYLRTVWGELSRLHSHLLWLGLMADGMGFESLFMHSWRMREKVLNIIEATTGGRVIFGSCKVGGVRRDINADTIKTILTDLDGIEKDMRDLTRVFLNDRSVKARLSGIGVLTKQEAWDLGCVGPMLRASGVAQDMRQQGYAAFKDIPVVPITRTEGDSYARCAVRCEELFQSLEIIRQAFEDSRWRDRRESHRQSHRRDHHAHRTAARRGGLPFESQRLQIPAAVPRAHADVCQPAGHVEGVAGLRPGRRADDCAHD